MTEVDNFLAHYGVKGMKWGKRKADDSSSNGERRLSRKEHRAKVKQERSAFYQKKADKLLEEVMNDPDVLVNVRTLNGSMIATGKEFVNFMAKGGVMDIRATDIYARKTADGKNYQMNSEMNKQYKPPKR